MNGLFARVTALFTKKEQTDEARFSDVHKAVELVATEQQLSQRTLASLTAAELRWAAKAEQIVHLDDLLLRRTRLGNLLPNGGLDDAARIRAICQPELGWNDAKWDQEQSRYQALWERAYGI